MMKYLLKQNNYYTEKVKKIVYIFLIPLISTISISAQPLALHPENNHYFIWKGKPTILITSGEHYGALLNMDFDFEVYLDALATDNLNNTRIFSGTYREVPGSFGISNNTLAPKVNRYASPWARSNESGYFDGTNKFDLTKWNQNYFERLHNFMKAAEKRQIIVEMVLFCPFYSDKMWEASPMNLSNNINGAGNCPRDEIFTLKHPEVIKIHEAFVRKIVQELNRYDNLYFEVLNEPWAGGVSDEWLSHIADYIKKVEDELPKRHLISFNVKEIKQPHPAISIYNFHGAHPPKVVGRYYNLNKAIGENETGFRGSHDLIYRTEGWSFIIAGGAIYNNLDYSFTPENPEGTFLDYKSPGGGSPSLRKQLSILKNFMESFDVVKMKPMHSIVKNTSEELTSYVLADTGIAYAAYFHIPLPWKPEDPEKLETNRLKSTITIDLPKGKYKAEWISTKNGNLESTHKFKHSGGEKTIASPEFSVDIALKISSTK